MLTKDPTPYYLALTEARSYSAEDPGSVWVVWRGPSGYDFCEEVNLGRIAGDDVPIEIYLRAGQEFIPEE